MLRRTSIKAKRSAPRRNLGRIEQDRIRPKERKEPSHLAAVAQMGCLVCGRPATVHHVTSDGMKRITRSDRRVVPLCPCHHQIQFDAYFSVEALGHAGFKREFGMDLLEVADEIWANRRS